MTKRILIPKAKPGELIAQWGRPGRGESPNLCYAWGGSGVASSEGRILCAALEEVPVYEGRSLVQELKERGFDITTIRFSVKQKSN